ncbi:anti-sigma F factor antagonist [Anaeromicropila herbilytica]|uniref:Anti-sigma F factor antagonist n=1 Tax=Anaeromicropila herbilytica TaxID=2785025 RepID=A0A7R7EJK8_9FIRM|nr:anti-sigma F factor antagonist [Anaeromicropila herbilytica]BCN30026.1 anti-sigma F factor antagonist [Anaeromicropila herbilytica]
MENNKEELKNGNEEQSNAIFEVTDHCLIIKLTSELDHHCALKIREKSDSLIAKGNIKNIIFDFKEANFMDSSGIGVIMGRYKKVIFTGGKVAVTNVNETVDRIFRISGLYKIIEKYETIKDAKKAL